ncbi:MAG: hypothetical protein RIS79_41 [Verrucomicrobiota bacterium]
MKRPLFQILRLVLLSALGGASWVAHRPEPLPEAAPLLEKGKAPDLLDDLRQAAIKRAGLYEVKEADLNRYLTAVLPGRLGSTIESWMKVVDARADLEPGKARIILVWNIYGHQRTASVDLVVQRVGEHFHVEVLGGALGHLRLPRGVIRPLEPALRVVAGALDPEIRALFQMTQITVAKDKLVLDSRFTSA